MGTITGKEIIGRAVVSVNDGEKLGMITDVQVDYTARRVVGLALGGGGMLHKAPDMIIPYADVTAVAAHAVTVQQKSVAVSPNTAASSVQSLGDVKKRVLNDAGEIIGDGDDLQFNDANGEIVALQLVSKGGFLGVGGTAAVIPVGDVIGFGRDVITVRATAATTPTA